MKGRRRDRLRPSIRGRRNRARREPRRLGDPRWPRCRKAHAPLFEGESGSAGEGGVIASFARRAGLMFVVAVLLQLVTVTAIASLGPGKTLQTPYVTSASLLADTLWLDRERPIVMYSIDQDSFFRACGVEPGALGKDDDNILNRGAWSPSSARTWLSAQQNGTVERWQEAAAQERFEKSTSEFERRFLIGCINGSLFAPLCRSYAVRQMDAAEARACPHNGNARLPGWTIGTQKPHVFS